MREIKFRAWDKENEKMLEVANISFDKEAYGYDLITIDKAKESPMLWTFNRLEDFVLMQYAGLKDKNGVEIFEGDIVKSQDGTGGLIYKHIVEWNDFYKGFDPMRKDESYFNRRGCEIIGNIYENGDLLEVAE